MPHEGRTALYRFFDRDGTLLYVGITSNVANRWAAHAADKPWWGNVTLREIEWLASREDAEREETAAIHREKPLWNASTGLSARTPPQRRAPAGHWQPPQSLVKLVAAHERALKRLGQLRDDLEAAAVTELHAGVSPYRLAKFLPWTEAHVRAMARAKGIKADPRYQERAEEFRARAARRRAADDA